MVNATAAGEILELFKGGYLSIAETIAVLCPPPSDACKLRKIMQDCLSAAQTYRGFDRPVGPASVVAIYERIAASIALALV